jgi:hypothetical protein
MNSARILPFSVVLALALTSCAFEPFPHYITGSYAHSLHFGDIVEIRDLVRNRKDLRHPICGIEALAPDLAKVSSGTGCDTGGMMSFLTVRKRNGHWIVDKSSIEQAQTIVTE